MWNRRGFNRFYECKKGKQMKQIIIEDVKIEYDAGNVRIVNSYRVNDVQKMRFVLRVFRTITEYKSKRTLKSWIKEWKAHNRLYRLGLFKTHMIDCDLEENEKKWRLLAYEILGI